MIEYEEFTTPRGRWEIRVRLNRKLVGAIRIVDGGFRYFPHGAKKGFAGELFKTVREVQTSLEGDARNSSDSNSERGSDDDDGN
jgi:hypothetical protein